jgi:hypothetical protein
VADRRDRIEGHEQIADALETQQQDGRTRAGGGWLRASPQERPDQDEPGVGQADEPSFPPIPELQMGKQGPPY